MISKTPKLINEKDGTVSRSHICECGCRLYKKNLTNGELFFYVRLKDGYPEGYVIEPEMGSILAVTCIGCKTKHFVSSIEEKICV